MIGGQLIEGDAGTRGPTELFGRTISLDIERFAEIFHASGDLGVCYFFSKRGELIDFYNLGVTAEVSALLGEIAVDVEHAAVIVAHDSQAIVLHDVSDPGGIEPLVDLSPGDGVVVDHPGDLEKWD